MENAESERSTIRLLKNTIGSSLPRRRESRNPKKDWIPASAGMTANRAKPVFQHAASESWGADDPVCQVFKKNTISSAEGFDCRPQLRVTESIFFKS